MKKVMSKERTPSNIGMPYASKEIGLPFSTKWSVARYSSRFVVQEQLFRAVAAVLHWFIVNRHSGFIVLTNPTAPVPYDDDKNDLLFLAEPLKIKEASPLCKFKQMSSFFYPLTRGWRAQGHDS
nr:hypothetical protein [Paenibacillus agaridevorans]